MIANLTDREGTTIEVTIVATEDRHVATGADAPADHIHVTWVELASDVAVAFPTTYQLELADGTLLEIEVALCTELPAGGYHLAAVLPGASPFAAPARPEFPALV